MRADEASSSNSEGPRSGSFHGGLAGGDNPDEFVARFQTTKLSWKGKYERIFALSASRFCTIDPKDFDVTNSWSYVAFISLELDPTDEQIFTLTIQGPKKEEQLKLRYKYRAYLLTEFLRLHAANAQSLPRAPPPLQCKGTKLTRHGVERECVLEVAPDGLVYKQMLSSISGPMVMERFPYTDMEHMTPLTNSTTGCIVGAHGKQTVFFTSDRAFLTSHMEKAAARLGLRLPTRGKLTLEQVAADKRLFDPQECIVQFPVQKFSKRHEKPVRRVLALVQGNVLLELETKTAATAISVFPLKSLFAVVRHPHSSQFELEFVDGTQRAYACHDRDGVLAALADAVPPGDEPLVISSTPSQSGLRLLPRFAVEDTSESTSFFGDSSIGACFLKRLASMGKYTAGGNGIRAGAAAGRGLVSIACEFNANVPMSGIQYHTKRSIVLDALRPLAVQLHTVATCKPPAPRMAVTLLQCICRIATSFYGFRELLHLPQVIESLHLCLQAEDELTVFWTALLIQRLTMHTATTGAMPDGTGTIERTIDGNEQTIDVESVLDKRSTNGEAELNNKKLLLGQEKIIAALVAVLGKFSLQRSSVGPLSFMGNLKVLEGALCSHKHTTDAPIVRMIIDKLVPHYDALTRLLFRSRCATTVEACTLLVQTVLLLCSADAAASIKDAALRQGLVLQHLYQAMFDPSFDQRCVSRYMISMWMSDYVPAKQLLRRIFPPGLVSCLDMRLLSAAEVFQLDDLEQSTFMDKFGAFNAELLVSRRTASEISLDLDSDVDDGSSVGDGNTSTIHNSTFSLGRSSLFDDDSVVSEIVSSSKLLDRMQIKARGNVFDEHTNGQSQRGSQPSPIKQGLKDGVFNLRLLQRALRSTWGGDRHVAATVATATTTENFRILFHMAQQDHETIDLVWGSVTREELRNALVQEIHLFRAASSTHDHVVWNFEDFSVAYASLDAEMVVDGLYLRHLLSCQVAPTQSEDTFAPPLHLEEMILKKPKRFVNALYKKILREQGEAEFKGHLDWTVACLRALTMVTYMYELDYHLPTEDLGHLVVMLRQTTRRDLLVHVLRALRSIAKVPQNGSKLLKEADAVPLLVQLMQMAHTSQRPTDTAALALWSSPDNGATPKSVDALREWLHATGRSPYDVRVVRRSTDGHDQPLTAIPQLKWELGMDGSFDVVAVAHDAIRVLLALLKSNPLLTPDAAVYPIPLGRQLATVQLAEIASLLMLFELPKLVELAAHVLVHLSLESEQLYLTGVYYMLFLYQGTAFGDFARFLKATHKTQAAPVTGNLRKILTDLLPQALIVQLDALSSVDFGALFCGDTASPRVIWSPLMRDTLWRVCKAHLDDHRRHLQEDVAAPFAYHPMAPVVYRELDDEVFCHGYYLRQFCNTRDVDVKDPGTFLSKLAAEWTREINRPAMALSRTDAARVLDLPEDSDDVNIRRAYKDLCRPVCPENANGDPDKLARFETLQQAYAVLVSPRDSLLTAGYDAVNLLLVLRAQNRLFAAYPLALESSKFEAYPQLLELLATHCTNDPNVPALTSRADQLALSMLALELVYHSCAVSSQNGPWLLSQARVGVLEDVLQHCVDQIVADNAADAPTFTTLACFLMRTISGLVATAAGRAWVLRSARVVSNCWRVLWYYNTHVATESVFVLVRHTLEAIASMHESTDVQDIVLHKSGILWQLLYLWFSFDPTVDEATAQPNNAQLDGTILLPSQRNDNTTNMEVAASKNALAMLAVRAICAAQANLTLQVMCNSLLTPNLYFQSSNPSHAKFLGLFHRDTVSHRLIWTTAMRVELHAFLDPIVRSIETFPDMNHVMAFRYTALEKQKIIEGMYVDPLFVTLMTASPGTLSIDFVRQLGLPASFYDATVDFIHTGNVVPSAVVGWGLTDAHVLEFREKCMAILATLAPLATPQVEAGFLARQGLLTLFSFVLPPAHKFVTPSLAPLVPPPAFAAFQRHSLTILKALATSKQFADALFQASLFPVLMHAAHLEDESSAAVLETIGQLCATSSTIARFVASSIWFYHVLLWAFPASDAVSITDADYDFGKLMQVPAAKILSALGQPTSAVLEETMNVLVRLLPVALVAEIIDHPIRVMTILQSHYEAPDLVWNDTLRSYFYSQMNHLSVLVNKATDGGVVSEELAAFEIDYATVYPYPMIGDVYLMLYLENPIHPLKDPKFFLECLMEDFETLCHALVTSLGNRGSFDPDLAIAHRQQAQILPLITSCIVCALRVYPSYIDEIANWKYPDKLCSLFVLLQNEVHGPYSSLADAEANAVEMSLLRLFRILFVSPRVVASLAYSPFNILSRLIKHCRVSDRAYHTELGFILETIRRFLLSFPDNGDKHSDKNVVAVVSGLHLLEFLLDMLEHPQTLQNVADATLTRVTIIATLNYLEQHRTQGSMAHQVLKKNKKWDKVFRLEPTDAIRGQPEDKFLVGPGANADRMIRSYLASQAGAGGRPSSVSQPPVHSATRKVGATQKLKNLFK
ncbi:Aste57867_22167 [Aphanomyces stellatus]|uniref:Aste57867_22167 protein n=1 Tax=Aphanomyces stellatus TaxID=120398 RepID=A0A485LLG2_9STRA|nr:hypothetical protein As57867_022098 [Aphanomyces stellatus]VFT98834.1 Aste57867_22167 [Aphanomyces stellatus]